MPVNMTTPRKRRLPRAARACERCRSKKYKCDEAWPCLHCKKSRFECVYSGTKRQQQEDSLATRNSEHFENQELRIQELTARLLAAENALSMQQFSSPQHNHDALGMSESSSTLIDDGIADTGVSEITGINQHTKMREYHGSSLALAILGQVQQNSEDIQQKYATDRDETPSLISVLHNPEFHTSSVSPHKQPSSPIARNIYVEQASVFLESYFDTVHYIHPIIDKEDFTARAKDLWLGHSSGSSFMALYYSVLSLGALVRVWEEHQVLGMTRFEWSRKLFQDARICLSEIPFSTELDVIQSLFLMTKICQNELDPNLAYMYLGTAIRACLAAGYNRETPNSDNQQASQITNTWWAIYSLEIELAFSLGRPDTLGMDDYHTRQLPESSPPESAIIPCMVTFAHIVRQVSVRIYTSKISWQEKLMHAGHLQSELDAWVEALPPIIRPDTTIAGCLSQLALREPKWSRRQRLIIRLRYYNLKAALFRPFLSQAIFCSGLVSQELVGAVQRCSGAARKTIEIIHETFRIHDFFRTWWYNATNIIFAASVILHQMTQITKIRPPGLSLCPLLETNMKVVEMAVELLEAMDESVVARKAAEFLKQNLGVLRSTTISVDATAAAAIPFDNFPLDTLVSPYVEQGIEDEAIFPGLGLHDYDFPQDMTHSFGEVNHGTPADISTFSNVNASPGDIRNFNNNNNNINGTPGGISSFSNEGLISSPRLHNS